MLENILFFIGGIFVGGFIGMLTIGLCTAAKEGDNLSEQFRRKN